MTESQKLIAEYVERGSEAAFRELVSQYVNLVYSAAVRLVNGDTHLAEDVVQLVFADLAQMAPTLRREVMLGGWLHRHTCFVAAKTMRGERRRQFRERRAVEMNALQEQPEVSFAIVAPILDEAINELGELERTAILLRFFEQRDFPAIGSAMGGSADSARMRVNRALEKLRLRLKRRGVHSTTTALSVALSANALQAAPSGMAASVCTFALGAGTAPAASTVLAIAKTATLMTMQKAVFAGLLALGVGTAIYEALQAASARADAESLQQQQTPMVREIEALLRQRDSATNRLAELLAETSRLESGSSGNELLQLRGEVTRLKAAQAQRSGEPTVSAAKEWLARVEHLKQYLAEHPGEKIPEFQFLTEARWLNAVDLSVSLMDFKNPDDYYRDGVRFLRSMAETDFGGNIQVALSKYAEANQGQFPTELSQLQGYCESVVAAILEQLYEIKPASLLPAATVKELKIKTDWVVVRKESVVPDSRSREAFFAGGCASWQPPAGGENR